MEGSKDMSIDYFDTVGFQRDRAEFIKKLTDLTDAVTDLASAVRETTPTTFEEDRPIEMLVGE